MSNEGSGCCGDCGPMDDGALRVMPSEDSLSGVVVVADCPIVVRRGSIDGGTGKYVWGVNGDDDDDDDPSCLTPLSISYHRHSHTVVIRDS